MGCGDGWAGATSARSELLGIPGDPWASLGISSFLTRAKSDPSASSGCSHGDTCSPEDKFGKAGPETFREWTQVQQEAKTVLGSPRVGPTLRKKHLSQGKSSGMAVEAMEPSCPPSWHSPRWGDGVAQQGFLPSSWQLPPQRLELSISLPSRTPKYPETSKVREDPSTDEEVHP